MTADPGAYRLEPLDEAAFSRERERLEALLELIRVPPERRRPEDVLVPGYRDPRLSFVARDAAGAVVGFLTAYPSAFAAGGVFVPWLAVAPAARGQGLGRALMEAAFRASAAAGFELLFLYVQEGDTDALAFYDHLRGIRLDFMPSRDDAELRRGGQWVYAWRLPRPRG